MELEWLKMLAAEPGIAEVAPFSPATIEKIDAVIAGFSVEHARNHRAIEARTNHDVKAIEYWLKETLSGNAEVMAASEFIPLLHLGRHQQPVARADAQSRPRTGVAAKLDEVVAK